MFFSDDELLPISGLQHIAFCPRQCALIHLERVWIENYLTASGKVMHERVHNAPSESRGNVRTARGLMLRSTKLGLTGVADVVEFHRIEPEEDLFESACTGNKTADPSNELETNFASLDLNTFCVRESDSDQSPLPEQHLLLSGKPPSEELLTAVHLPKKRGLWRPYPVEYKRGNPKKDNCDTIQLCAQAICLEEMLHCVIHEGALYYGQTKRREIILFNDSLRHETEQLAQTFHTLINSGQTPSPNFSPKCRACSLADECLPEMKTNTVLNYLNDQWNEVGDNL